MITALGGQLMVGWRAFRPRHNFLNLVVRSQVSKIFSDFRSIYLAVGDATQ